MTRSFALSAPLKTSHHANYSTRLQATTRPSTNGRLALLRTKISLPVSWRSPKNLRVQPRHRRLSQSYEGIETRSLPADRELHSRSDRAQGASHRAGSWLRGFDQPG